MWHHFIIICATILGTRLATGSLTTSCPADKFHCGNNSFIDKGKICNGVKDCANGNDERFGVCFNTTCPGFRCNYGGCVDISAVNDNKTDCWDGSDENKLLDENVDLLGTLQGRCSAPFTFMCRKPRTGEPVCVKMSQLCDGHKHCEDGSDESAEFCTFNVCGKRAFRCKYGACISIDKVCNRQADCFDSSDEYSALCAGAPKQEECAPVEDPHLLPPSSTIFEDEVPIYAITTTWELTSQTCALPLHTGMYLSNYFSDYRELQPTPDRTVVRVNCESGYEFDDKNNNNTNKCIGNEWKDKWPKISRVCMQKSEVRHIQYLTHATLNNKPIDPTQKQFKQTTVITVTCAPGYSQVPSNGQSLVGKHICKEDGEWTTEDENPICKPVCGIQSPHHPNVEPWTVSLFERSDYKRYKFKCLGTILSPHIILTATNCISTKMFSKVRETHLYYSVVEGNFNTAFDLNAEHGYAIHNVSKVEPIPPNLQTKSVILHLVQPLKIGGKVRPVCIEETLPTKDSFDNVDPALIGKAVTKIVDNKYVITHIVAEEKKQYGINQLLTYIQKEIDERTRLATI
ncbi:maker573 [Drosophila busckii]|uniref:Maker573 n=1 Tax=Drosophila busckii TaxID=30019 RepID=A0A0M5IWV3_DROBS|nr:modular serine protease [Drosophila busckii]ALC40018.1 maker573 [Drosophila busckii]